MLGRCDSLFVLGSSLFAFCQRVKLSARLPEEFVGFSNLFPTGSNVLAQAGLCKGDTKQEQLQEAGSKKATDGPDTLELQPVVRARARHHAAQQKQLPWCLKSFVCPASAPISPQSSSPGRCTQHPRAGEPTPGSRVNSFSSTCNFIR